MSAIAAQTGLKRSRLQNIDGSTRRPITPQGRDGLFLTVNHTDYVCARDTAGIVKLYPIDGGEPKTVPGVTADDQIVGGSIDSNLVYISTGQSPVSRPIAKLNITSGRRQPFVTVSPTAAAGVTSVGRPIFTRDEKRLRIPPSACTIRFVRNLCVEIDLILFENESRRASFFRKVIRVNSFCPNLRAPHTRDASLFTTPNDDAGGADPPCSDWSSAASRKCPHLEEAAARNPKTGVFAAR